MIPERIPECMECEEPATRRTADDVPLCEGCYLDLLRSWNDEPRELAVGR